MTPMIASILNLVGPDMIIVLFIVVLLFGAKKLPEATRSVAQSLHIFKQEMQHTEPPAEEPKPQP